MKSIVLTGGGTAGHVTPHFAIYPYIKDYFDKFYYIGSENGIEKALTEDKFEYFSVTTAKLNRSFTFENLKIIPRVFKGIKDAEKILQDIKPDLVFSKGGFVAVPVAFASKKLKIPVITHESDYTLGLANKLIYSTCDYLLTSFQPTAQKLKKRVFTGPPIRGFNLNRQKALSYFSFKNNKPILLVMGGSIGSKRINDMIIDLLPDLLKKFNLLHLSGQTLEEVSIDGYRRLKYLKDMSLAYSCADLAVSRAGAGASFELMSLQIPTLFIPLSKKASRGDQILNARYFYSKKACNVLYEENLSPNNLLSKIEETYKNSSYYINNMKKLKLLNGNINIAEILKKYGNT